MLGLVERLQTRIADIDRTVGLDASVLGEAVSRRSFEELKRIRAEDQSVLDELEQESELSYGDEMRLPLISALQLLGEAFVEDIPLGIHSVHASPQGAHSLFFAFRVGERVVWRTYPLAAPGQQPGGVALTSKREIYRLIEARQDTPRAETPGDQVVFPYLEQAVRDILSESTRAAKKGRFKVPLKGNNLILSTWLQDMHVRSAVDPEVHTRLLYTLENRSLSGFERDPALKAILAELGVCRTIDVAAELEGFLVDNKLLVDHPSERVSVQEITRTQIKLIAYEWLT